MLGLGNPVHLIFLLLVVLLVFGAKRLPEMGRSLGAGLRGFEESINGEQGIVPVDQLSSASAPAHDTAAAPVAEHTTV
jgi:sec-independent protein translocase protein TatA